MYFSCFWNFPETAWWVMNHRQATHPFLGYFGVQEMEPPSGASLAVMNTRQTTRVNLAPF